MTKEQTSQKEDIKQQLQKLREEANTANAQISKHIENRNQLNDQFKKARGEIDELKKERDSINEKVKALKQERNAIRAQTSPITEEINLAKGKIDELKKKLPRVSQGELQEEFDAIEWKIQTTSLDLKEEKLLIEDVKQLEIQLSGYKKIDAQHKKINDLIAQRRVFDNQADVVHKELTVLANNSQALHSIIVEKVNSTKMIRAQADGEHQAFLKTKEEISSLYEKITELSMQLRGVYDSLREEYKARKVSNEQTAKDQQQAFLERQQATKAKEQAIREKLETEAKEKLQKGEKLSWDEFKLVMGDDAEDKDSETQN